MFIPYFKIFFHIKDIYWDEKIVLLTDLQTYSLATELLRCLRTQTESIGEGLSTEKCENKEHSVTRSSNLKSNFWLKSKVYRLKMNEKNSLIAENASVNY